MVIKAIIPTCPAVGMAERRSAAGSVLAAECSGGPEHSGGSAQVAMGGPTTPNASVSMSIVLAMVVNVDQSNQSYMCVCRHGGTPVRRDPAECSEGSEHSRRRGRGQRLVDGSAVTG